MRIWRFVVILLFCGIMGCISVEGQLDRAEKESKTTGNDWPMLWHDAAHSFVSPCKISPPLKPLWTYKGTWYGHPRLDHRPIVVNGVLYTLAGDKDVVAIDIRTGKERWRIKGDFYGCLVGDNKRVYVNVSIYVMGGWRDSGVVALDRQTGREVWRYTFPEGEGWYGVYRFPTLAGDTIYLIPTGAVYALDVNTGGLRWQFKVKKRGWNIPAAIHNNTAYFVSTGDKMVYALDTATGKPKWTKQVDWSKSADFEGIAYQNNRLYMAPGGGVTYCISAKDGSFIFATKGTGMTRFPYVDDGRIYMQRHQLCAFSASDGSLKWEYKGEVGSCCAMSIANEFLWLVGPHQSHRKIRCYDCETGRLVWETDPLGTNYVSCAGPVIAAGMVFVADNRNNLHAFVPATDVSKLDRELIKAIRDDRLSSMPELAFEGVKESSDRFLVSQCVLNLIKQEENIAKVVSLIGQEALVWKQVLIISHLGKRCGEKTSQVLRLGLADNTPGVRRTVVEILGKVDIPERFDLLIKGVLDKEQEVMNASVDNLIAIGDTKAANALGEAISQKESICSELWIPRLLNVTEALGKGEGRSVKSALNLCLKSKDQGVRCAAVRSLAGVIKDDEELKRLLHPLKSDTEKKVRLEVMRVFAERKIGLEDEGKEEDILPDIPE